MIRTVCAFMVVWIIRANNSAFCQDIAYARTVIDKLCSESFHGRGYAKKGDRRSADYIRKELSKTGISSFGDQYFQCFPVQVNTFPGKMICRVNGKNLMPGLDYIIDPASPGLKGRFIPGIRTACEADGGKQSVLLYQARCRAGSPVVPLAGIEISENKPTYGISSQLAASTNITIQASACPDSIAHVQLKIKNRYLSPYITQNVIGYVPGTSCPDSFLIFTAHYDHLGLMGRKTHFPGANDNASGVALALSLARYFKVHPQRFSVAFIFFSGEELGLMGSAYFTENSPISLSAVKFLINLDLVGTGSDGITVVNATEFPDQFETLAGINKAGSFIHEVKKRGSSCNSDHCPFFRKGVPCFYIYTVGGIAAYHDIFDRPETLPLTAFEGLTRLLVEFCGSL